MATFIEKADLIKEAVQKEQGTDPIVIAKHLMHLPGISMAIADEGTRNFTDFSNGLMRIFLIAKAKDYFHSLLLSTLEIHLKR